MDQRLSTASVILLLISASFMASNYGHEGEMQRAVQQHEAGSARVIPILLRPCDWQSGSFGKLHALPSNAKPVTSWTNQDEAFFDITQGLRRVIGQQSSLL